jgi:hypothetical protein
MNDHMPLLQPLEPTFLIWLHFERFWPVSQLYPHLLPHSTPLQDADMLGGRDTLRGFTSRVRLLSSISGGLLLLCARCCSRCAIDHYSHRREGFLRGYHCVPISIVLPQHEQLARVQTLSSVSCSPGDAPGSTEEDQFQALLAPIARNMPFAGPAIQ